MRTRAVAWLGAAAVAAFVLSACGSSSKNTATTVASHSVSASVMADAANKAAAQAGYAFTFQLAASGSSLKGSTNARGTGKLQAKKPVGTITLSASIPKGLGSASLLGSIQTEVLAPGTGKLYVKVPSAMSALLGGKQWLEADAGDLPQSAGISPTNLASSAPCDAFTALAKVSTGTATNLGTATIDGRQTTHYRELVTEHSGATATVEMWIAADGLPYRIASGFATHGAHGLVTIDFSDFGAQPAPSSPPPSQVGSFKSVLAAASSLI